MARFSASLSLFFSRKIAPILLLVLMCLHMTTFSWAQAQDVNDSTATPVGGVGHDYIGMLNETVNPATGSVSLRIHVPVPPGRKLSIPFAFAYDSTSAWRLAVGAEANAGEPPLPPAGYSYNSANRGLLAYGGWSAAVPQLSALQYSWVPNHPTTDGSKTCDIMASFVFVDPAAGMHQLSLVHIINSQAQACQGVPASEIDSNGDGEYQAVITNSGTGDVRVASPDGTVYDFYFGGSQGSCVSGNGAICELPSWIEDRNGNILTVAGGILGSSPTITDDTGRTAVAVTNFLGPNGGGSVGSGSVAVSGMGNSYTINWEGVTANGFPISLQKLGTDSACNAPPTKVGATLPTAVQSVVLPNGQQYSFSYDSATGFLSRVTYPTGGYVSYTWGTNPLSSGVGYNDGYGSPSACAYLYDTPAVQTRTVSFDGTTAALKQTFTYNTSWNVSQAPYSVYWTTKSTTVTTQDLVAGTASKTIYTYGSQTLIPPPAYNPGIQTGFVDQGTVENSIAYYGYSSQGYPLLRTETKSVSNNPPRLGCDLVTLDNGMVSGFLQNYGTGNQVTDKKEYDFGVLPTGSTCQNLTNAPTPTRETKTTYQSFAATPIYPTAASIFDRPSSVQVYAGTTLMAETDYAYDGAAVAGVSSLTGHDETNYSSSYNNRGNATTKTVKCLSGCSNAVTTYTFDETGQRTSSTDPCGNGTCNDIPGTNHTTTYTYTDNYLAGSGSPPGATNAYVTTITHPTVGSVTTHSYFQYAYSDGQLTASQDDNDKAASASTSYAYADSLRRLTETDQPDGGQVTLSYNDTPPSPSVTKSVLITASPSLSSVTTTTMDGMGHTVKTQLTSDPDGADTTDTTYDGFGKVLTQSNPHRSTSATTDGTRTNAYDALGRITSVLQSDGSTVSTTYSGNCTTVTDETGNTRTSCTDGLGRLTQVFEAPSSLNYETDYQYDVLNNLLCAVQKGTDTSPFTTCASAKASWRPRSFQYDSLSRIVSASNPESGTISYSYDLNGNLILKTSPKPNQTNPATTSNVNFCYDALNRMTSKAYNTASCPPSSPQAAYTYDQGTNGIGRRTGMTDTPGSASWTYDIMGRTASERRVTSGVTKTTNYSYNKDGSVNSITYPSTRVVNYTYSGAGRAISAIDPTGPINYVTSATYAPPGQLVTALNGYVSGGFAGISTSNIYGTRLQPILLSASAGPNSILSLCYDFHMKVPVNSSPCNFNASSVGDNGNVFQIVNNRDGNRTQNFLYDALNRVQQAYTNGPNWGETFSPLATNPGTPPSMLGIDAWANLTNRSGVNGKTYYEGLNCPANTSNQLMTCSLVYDAAGNVTSDGSLAYTYDSENRMTKFVASTTDIYIYDGDSQRVKKTVPGVTLYWYGATGNVLDETGGTGTLVSEYVYFNGKRVARRDVDNSVHYYFSDHLGSASAVAGVVNNAAVIQAESDFYPYGGEIQITTGDSNHYKFTGKERDAESGLDNFGARYDSSSFGRFMTPDWAARPTTVPYATFGDPQSLNLYTYVENNPLNRVDADGHCKSIADQAAAGSGTKLQNQMCAAEQADQSEANNTAKAKAAQHTVTVEQVKGQGANVADHAAISLDGKRAVGLEQKKDSASAALEDKTTPGAVRPVDPNREVKDKAVIPVTKDQAEKIQTFLDKATKSPPDYNLYHSNCAQFCESALRAGGVQNVPNDVLPAHLVQDLKGSQPTDYFFVAP